MNTTIESPAAKAERIAREIDADPVAARLVNEFLTSEKIESLLELEGRKQGYKEGYDVGFQAGEEEGYREAMRELGPR